MSIPTGPAGPKVASSNSTAILLYLGEKTGKLMGSPADRGELLSWLFFIATGLGPFSGQAVHFQRATPEKLPYAINRYRREAERHYTVLDKHLEGREFIVGKDYTIADISAWGWVDRASFVLPGSDDPLAAYPNIRRWFHAINDAAGGCQGAGGGQRPRLQERGRRRDAARTLPLQLSAHRRLTQMTVRRHLGCARGPAVSGSWWRPQNEIRPAARVATGELPYSGPTPRAHRARWKRGA